MTFVSSASVPRGDSCGTWFLPKLLVLLVTPNGTNHRPPAGQIDGNFSRLAPHRRIDQGDIAVASKSPLQRSEGDRARLEREHVSTPADSGQGQRREPPEIGADVDKHRSRTEMSPHPSAFGWLIGAEGHLLLNGFAPCPDPSARRLRNRTASWPAPDLSFAGPCTAAKANENPTAAECRGYCDGRQRRRSLWRDRLRE